MNYLIILWGINKKACRKKNQEATKIRIHGKGREEEGTKSKGKEDEPKR